MDRAKGVENYVNSVVSISRRLRLRIPQLTLLSVVVAVLVPAVNYSFRLSDPTPAQLLVAICIGVFSSVVCLWILDAVDILRFRSDWVSHSVWAAAIVSILGTGVGVFQGAFADRKYPFEGAWIVQVYEPGQKKFIAEHEAVLTYSPSNETYWGFSDTAFASPPDSTKAIAVEVVAFVPKTPEITLRLKFQDGEQKVLKQRLLMGAKGIRFNSPATVIDDAITISRPR